MKAAIAVVAAVLGGAAVLGCESEPEVRDTTMEPTPTVISPVRTGITGQPTGAGGIDRGEMPVREVVTPPTGEPEAVEIGAGEPIIDEAERVRPSEVTVP